MKTLTEMLTKFVNLLKKLWALILRFVEIGGLKTVWKFVLKYNEWFFSFPVGMVLMYYGTVELIKRGLDAYDLGVIQKLIIGLAFFFFIIGVSRIAHRLQWPILSKLNDEDTNSKWEKLSDKERHWYSLISWSVLFLGLSILIAGI